MEKSNKLPLPLRWWGLVIGVITFFWLPNEDTDLLMLVAVSTGWCVWLAGWLLYRLKNSLQIPWQRVLTVGIGGLGLFPVALLLVTFKAGLHQHGFLDFSNFQLRRVFALTPFWCAGGILLGVLLEIIVRHRRDEESSNR